MKRALVESFVGAIALGWLFAQSAIHFVYIFVAPVTSWLARRPYSQWANQPGVSSTFSLKDSVPELARFVGLIAVGYILLRWLYYTPIEQDVSPSTAKPE